VVAIMSDAAILAANTIVELRKIAKQAAALGEGLQNAAPGDKSGKPNNSVDYLLAIAEALTKAAEQCEKMKEDTIHSNMKPN